MALHQAVAERIKVNPELIGIAKDNLRRWKEQYHKVAAELPYWLLEWERILNQESLETILQLLVSQDEQTQRLRQSSPFAGILSIEERIKIYESFTIGAYYSRRRKHHRR